jgi:hypothetical protein
MELRGYDVVFEIYKGPFVVGNAIRNLDVSVDLSLTKVFNATSYPAEYTHGSVLVNHSSVPEFTFTVVPLVIAFASSLIFYRIKLEF